VTSTPEKLSEADFQLYWAFVNDQIIERDQEIEKAFEEFLARSGE